MKKLVLHLLGLLIASALVIFVVGIRKLGSLPPTQPIIVTEADRNTPMNLLDKKKDRNYVTTLSKFPNVLQIQGVISKITNETFNIWSQKNYTVSTTSTSVVECRDKFIRLPDGSLALAYSHTLTFPDMWQHYKPIEIRFSSRESSSFIKMHTIV